MNIVKFRPVGKPSAPVTRVKVYQSKRAIYGTVTRIGRVVDRRASLAQTCRMMDARGFVRTAR